MVDRAARGGGVATPLIPAFTGGDSNAGVVTNTPADWFGPGNPLPPTAPPEVSGRGWDFQPAYNLLQKPKQLSGVPFATLRALARNYDVLRTIIETRKDQIAAISWKIVARDQKDMTADQQARAKGISDFFAKPDKRHDWQTWLRMLMEDMLVIDAPTIYRRRTIGGGLYAYRPMDGATIKPVIDDWGDPPAPPAAAYQQILRGLPALNYTSEQLIYRPRNPNTYDAYGFSPVEQIITIISLGMQRESWQINYFTKGTIPDTLIGVPKEWSGDQIRQFQAWFDSTLSGNAQRRAGGAIFVPGDSAKSVHEVKNAELFGAAEEWMARVACFAFSISPQPFIKMMNRATSETQKEASLEEGLGPQKLWVKSMMDDFLREDFNSPDLEFAWAEEDETDPDVADQILDRKVKSGRITINEARTKVGDQPYTTAEANQPLVYTTNGYIALAIEDQVANAQQMSEVVAPPAEQDKGEKPEDGKPKQDAKPDDAAPPAKFASRSFGKAMAVEPDPIGQDRPLCRRAEKSITRTVAAALSECADDVAAQVAKALKAADAQKAASDVDIDALVAELDLEALYQIADDVADDLSDVSADSARRALAQVGADTQNSLVDQINQQAVDFARQRAAELVGKRWTPDGELIDNPNPKWAITDSTRTMLREIIAQGLADNIGTPAIADAIQSAAPFSKARAKIIAQTEVANANEQSKLIGWRGAGQAGVVVKKKWLTAGAEVCDFCLTNQAQGFIPLDHDFSSGEDGPPGHPGCRCVLISEVQK